MWYSERFVKPATPGKSKEYVTKHEKSYNFKPNFHRQDGGTRLGVLAFSCSLAIKLHFCAKKNPGYSSLTGKIDPEE